MGTESHRILLFDLEIAPTIAAVWPGRKYEVDVVEYVEQWYVLCFAYKWLDEKQVHVVSLRHFPRYKRSPTDDLDVVKALHALLDEAEIVVAHNGNSFDVKMARSKFMMHHLPVPSPFKQIDTKLLAKRYGRFNSNALDDLGQDLRLGRKLKHEGYEMWKKVMQGDPKAWNKMEKYNKQDVILLEKVYLELRPYMTNHPLSYSGAPCEVCEGTHLVKDGTRRRKKGLIQLWKCQDCGSYKSEKI